MSQEYTPVSWQDETTTTQGTLINAERLNTMQTAHHYADGFEEVDAIPTEDPGVDYHKVVYCTADTTFYRWDGTQWTADIDDDTKRLLLEHEADTDNPHQVTKAQVGLGNVDNTADADKPISTATQTALDGKADKATTLAGYGITDAYTQTQADTLLASKADKSDTYTKAQVDTALALKADKATTYTKAEADTLLASKADTTALDTVAGRVTALETADGQNVKLTTGQTITGKKTFSRNGGVITLSNPDFTLKPASGEKITNMDITDNNGTPLTNLMDYRRASGGHISLIRHRTESGSNVDFRIYDTYMTGLTPSASNPSNSLTTIGYVSNTSGSLNNLVHTNGDETISGAKTYTGTATFNQRATFNYYNPNLAITGGYSIGLNAQIKDDDYTATPASAYEYVNVVYDKNSIVQGRLYWIHDTDGSKNWVALTRSPDGTTISRYLLRTLADGSAYATSPTPTSAAPTTAVPTIAYVSDTGGSLNNLVHTSGDETVNGKKAITDLDNNRIILGFSSQSTAGWFKIYEWTGKANFMLKISGMTGTRRNGGPILVNVSINEPSMIGDGSNWNAVLKTALGGVATTKEVAVTYDGTKCAFYYNFPGSEVSIIEVIGTAYTNSGYNIAITPVAENPSTIAHYVIV